MKIGQPWILENPANTCGQRHHCSLYLPFLQCASTIVCMEDRVQNSRSSCTMGWICHHYIYLATLHTNTFLRSTRTFWTWISDSHWNALIWSHMFLLADFSTAILRWGLGNVFDHSQKGADCRPTHHFSGSLAFSLSECILICGVQALRNLHYHPGMGMLTYVNAIYSWSHC